MATKVKITTTLGNIVLRLYDDTPKDRKSVV